MTPSIRAFVVRAAPAALAFLGVRGALPGCGGKKSPNLLLISVDTLRPDRLGYMGHARPTSPVVDALAAEGVVFTRCYSVAGWTLPAMATILTGRYPREHGATDFHWGMDDRLPTLAGILRDHGYDTRGYVSHVFLKPGYGVAEGFGRYDYSVLNVGRPHEVSTAAPLTDLVMGELGSVKEPFFIWIHYFDPHFDYLEHEPWKSFGDGEIDRYDQEIAHTDREIGRLLGALREKGWYDRTAVVFTSDHGEEFGEHGGVFHYTLHEEVMRVPLVIRAPDLEPRRDDTLVEQIDLLPTLLGVLGVSPAGYRAFPGRDLFSGAPDDGRAFFERDRPPGYSQRGILEGSYKLMVIEEADTTRLPLSSRYEAVEITNVIKGTYLYDLSADPSERVNVYQDQDPRARDLLQKLVDQFAGGTPATREVQIDESLREKLRSLGYVH